MPPTRPWCPCLQQQAKPKHYGSPWLAERGRRGSVTRWEWTPTGPVDREEFEMPEYEMPENEATPLISYTAVHKGYSGLDSTTRF